VEHQGVTFHTANLGTAFARRTGRDELENLTVAYGRVGQWYIVRTHDRFFTQCIDAHLDSTRRFIASSPVQLMPLQARDAAIATAVLRPVALSAHMKTWLAHWRKFHPEVMKFADQASPPTSESRFLRAAGVLSDLLNHYQSMTIQAYREGDTAAIQVDVVYPK